ncbi:MAG TPA: DUF305 domain-containing protein [Casimicrobiaceae bacterium]|nr:DUF305 domain-containing protein [Casimicrobiaceae bacterium]
MKLAHAFQSKRVLIAILFLVSASFLTAQAQTSQAPAKSGGHSAGAHASSSDAAKAMHAAMIKGMKDMQAAPATGDLDRDFAVMMRLHHQQAVEMAEVQAKHGNDKRLKSMARKIIADQKREIRDFDEWLARRK